MAQENGSDVRQRFFNALVKKGYKFGGTQDFGEYEKAMSDPEKSRRIYSQAKKDGFKLDDYEKWSKRFGPQNATDVSVANTDAPVRTRQDGVKIPNQTTAPMASATNTQAEADAVGLSKTSVGQWNAAATAKPDLSVNGVLDPVGAKEMQAVQQKTKNQKPVLADANAHAGEQLYGQIQQDVEADNIKKANLNVGMTNPADKMKNVSQSWSLGNSAQMFQPTTAGADMLAQQRQNEVVAALEREKHMQEVQKHLDEVYAKKMSSDGAANVKDFSYIEGGSDEQHYTNLYHFLENSTTNDELNKYAELAYGVKYDDMSPENKKMVRNDMEEMSAMTVYNQAVADGKDMNGLEYFISKAASSMALPSVVKALNNWFGNEAEEVGFAAANQKLQAWDDSHKERWYGGFVTGAAEGTGMALDLAMMGGILHKGLLAGGIDKASKFLTRGIAQNSLKASMILNGSNIAKTAVSFGRLGVYNDIMANMADPFVKEQIKNRWESAGTIGGQLAELGEMTVEGLAHEAGVYAGEALTGAELGVVGAATKGLYNIALGNRIAKSSFSRNLARNLDAASARNAALRTRDKWGMPLSLATETGFFTVKSVGEAMDLRNEEIRKYNATHEDQIDEVTFTTYDDWSRDFSKNLGMIFGMKVASGELRGITDNVFKDRARMGAENLRKMNASMTGLDFQYMEDAGIGKYNGFDSKFVKRLLERKDGTDKTWYQSIIENEDVPFETRRKLKMAMDSQITIAGYKLDDEGDVVATLNPLEVVTHSVVKKVGDGRWSVCSFDVNGKELIRKEYSSEDAAKKAEKEMRKFTTANKRKMMEMFVGARRGVIEDEIAKYADENGIPRGEAMEMYDDWMTNKENATPQAIDMVKALRPRLKENVKARRQEIVDEVRREMSKNSGMDINKLFDKNVSDITGEEMALFDAYTKRLAEIHADEVTDPRIRAVEKVADNESGTVKTGVDKEGNEVNVIGGIKNKFVTIIDKLTGRKRQVTTDDVEVIDEKPIDQAVTEAVETYDPIKGPQDGNVVWYKEGENWKQGKIAKDGDAFTLEGVGRMDAAEIARLQDEHFMAEQQQQAIADQAGWDKLGQEKGSTQWLDGTDGIRRPIETVEDMGDYMHVTYADGSVEKVPVDEFQNRFHDTEQEKADAEQAKIEAEKKADEQLKAEIGNINNRAELDAWKEQHKDGLTAEQQNLLNQRQNLIEKNEKAEEDRKRNEALERSKQRADETVKKIHDAKTSEDVESLRSSIEKDRADGVITEDDYMKLKGTLDGREAEIAKRVEEDTIAEIRKGYSDEFIAELKKKGVDAIDEEIETIEMVVDMCKNFDEGTVIEQAENRAQLKGYPEVLNRLKKAKEEIVAEAANKAEAGKEGYLKAVEEAKSLEELDAIANDDKFLDIYSEDDVRKAYAEKKRRLIIGESSLHFGNRVKEGLTDKEKAKVDEYLNASRYRYDKIKSLAAYGDKVAKRIVELTEERKKAFAEDPENWTEEEVRRIFESLNDGDEDMKKLFDNIMKSQLGSGLRFRFVDNSGKGNSAYHSWNGTVTYDTAYMLWPLEDKFRGEVLLHEMVHTITLPVLDYVHYKDTGRTWYASKYTAAHDIEEYVTPEMEEGAREIIDIWNKLTRMKEKKVVNYNGGVGDYGMSNPHEMMSELTTKDFRDRMKETSLWEKFVNGLLKICGVNKAGFTETNAYDACMRSMDKILSNFSQFNYSQFRGYNRGAFEENASAGKEDTAQEEKAKENSKTIEAALSKIEPRQTAVNRYGKKRVEMVEKLAKALGVEFDWAKNGSIAGGSANAEMTKDRKMQIEAGNRNAVEFLFGHEITHDIRNQSEASYQKLHDAVKDIMGEEMFNEMLNEQRRLYYNENKKREAVGDELIERTDEQLEEEIVADFMGKVCRSEDLLQKYLDKMDAEASPKYIQAVKKMWDKLVDAALGVEDFAGVDVEDLVRVANNKAMAEHVTEMFENGLDAAKSAQKANNRQVVDAVPVATENVSVEKNEDGDVVSAVDQNEGQGAFSLKTWDESGRDRMAKFLDKQVEKGAITEEEKKEIQDRIENTYNFLADHADEYESFNRWSYSPVVMNGKKPAFSVIKKNGEYTMNLDFSLVCKKRRTLDALMREMVKNGTIGMITEDPTDIADLNAMIREYGFETACYLCFVDSRRFLQGGVSAGFAGKWNDAVKLLIPKGADADYHNFGGDETLKNGQNPVHMLKDVDTKRINAAYNKEVKENGKGTVWAKILKDLIDHPEDRKLLSQGDLMESRGFSNTKAERLRIMKLYNAQKGTGGPKAAEVDTQYMGDIERKQWETKKALEVGGVRIQSFSDYVPRMVMDYIEMFGDLAAMNLPVQSYTKEELYVRQFGMTGAKINMSLVPTMTKDGIAAGLDANGNYIWEKGQTFDYDTAMELQNDPRYGRNIGTIAVGVSDAHILKMLDDVNIKMIIPYHKSGLNKKVAIRNGIDGFSDYEGMNHTRDAKGAFGFEKKDTPKYKGKSSAAYLDWCLKNRIEPQYNKLVRYENDPRGAANLYLEWCKKNDLTPHFGECADGAFVNHPNYYKMLEDFNLYYTDAEGRETYSPQEPVKMQFPEELGDLMLRGLNEDNVQEGLRQEKISEMAEKAVDILNRKAAERKGEASYSLKEEGDRKYGMERGKDETLKEYAERMKEPSPVLEMARAGAKNEEETVKYSLKIDPVKKEELENLKDDEVEYVYRAMVLGEDGNLYPPMSDKGLGATSAKGKAVKTETPKLGQWEQSEEHPELINENGRIWIMTEDGQQTEVAYNPYIHTSRTMLNDQFAAAWRRPRLVTVRCAVPKSELTAGYHADGAKDGVGELEWKAGPVGGKLPADRRRKVILTRWCKPVEIVDVDEYAQAVKAQLEGTGLGIPFNCVNEKQREALVRAGVQITAPEGAGMNGKALQQAYKEWLNGGGNTPDGGGKPSGNADGTDSSYSLKFYGPDDPYKNRIKGNSSVLNAIKKHVLSKKYDKAGTDFLEIDNKVYIFDHADDEGTRRNVIDGDGFGIRAVMSFSHELQQDDLRILKNLITSDVRIDNSDIYKAANQIKDRRNRDKMLSGVSSRRGTTMADDSVVDANDGERVRSGAGVRGDLATSGEGKEDVSGEVDSKLSLKNPFTTPVADHEGAAKDKIQEMRTEMMNMFMGQRQSYFSRPSKDADDVKKLAHEMRVFVKERLSKEIGQQIGSARINSLLKQIDDAVKTQDVRQPVRTIQRMMNEAEMTTSLNEMIGLLSKKTQKKDQSGMVVATGMDNTVRSIYDAVRMTYGNMMTTMKDAEIKAKSAEINEARKDLEEALDGYGIDKNTWNGTDYSGNNWDILTDAEKQNLRDMRNKYGTLENERQQLKQDREDILNGQNLVDEATALQNLRNDLEQRELDHQNDPNVKWSEEDSDMLYVGLPMREALLKMRENHAELRDLKQAWMDEKDKLDAINKAGGVGVAKRRALQQQKVWAAEDYYMEKQKEIATRTAEINRALKNVLGQGAERLKAWKEEQYKHKGEVINMGLEDFARVRPLRQDETSLKRNIKNIITSILDSPFFNAPIQSLEYLLRNDQNHLSGEGKLYNYFFNDPKSSITTAWDTKDRNVEQTGIELDGKISEIWEGKRNATSKGKKVADAVLLGRHPIKDLKSLYADMQEMLDTKVERSISEKEAENSNRYKEDGRTDWSTADITEGEMTKGHALYLWLTWRQPDGRVKMMKMGYNQNSIDQIEDALGPEYLEFGEYVTDELLPRIREERYNPRYVEMFNTEMANHEHYFPLKLDQDKMKPKGGIEDVQSQFMQSLGTPNLKERVSNTNPIDPKADAMEVLASYLDRMEQWYAMAPILRDINTLHASQTFKQAMEGSHKGSFNQLMGAAQVATGSMNADQSGGWKDAENKFNKLFTHVISAGARGAIAFRTMTAIKQLLSYPAFATYSGDLKFQGDLAKYFFDPAGSQKWASENLQAFRQRSRSGDMGLEGMTTFDSIDKLKKRYGENGMMINRLFDQWAVAAGARAVYNKAKRDKAADIEAENKAAGITMTADEVEKMAHAWAVNQAEICYNQSQQSSRNEFSSAMQKSSNPLIKPFMLFQNANISYRRNATSALYDLYKLSTRDVKDANGNDLEAKEKAKSALKPLATYAMFSALLHVLWQGGGQTNNLAKLFNGGLSDDDKWSYLRAWMLGTLTNGTTFGAPISSYASGYEWSPYEIYKDTGEMIKLLKKDGVGEDEVAYQTFKSLARYTGGVNLETWENIMTGSKDLVMDAIEHGETMAPDMAMDFMAMLCMNKTDRTGWAEYLYSKYGPTKFADGYRKAKRTQTKSDQSSNIARSWVKGVDTKFYDDILGIEQWYKDVDKLKLQAKKDLQVPNADVTAIMEKLNDDVKAMQESDDFKRYKKFIDTGYYSMYKDVVMKAARANIRYNNPKGAPANEGTMAVSDERLLQELQKCIDAWKKSQTD